ncbi:MAG: transposase [Coleofasciculus sp. C1-SOL-03]|jgi:REP element-mobilizing transposase RayT|uniref:transposase n=1 Tax=Coleofasciculus sp. C1-SOL-03 TaxID=3069522 RepID=UPI0032F690EE
MKYNPDQHHRRSIRLKDYDYTQPGFYFITICTWQRQTLLGEIIDSQMQLSDSGKFVYLHWQNLLHYHPNLKLDEFVIMPNHLHGILILTADTTRQKHHSLPEIIRGFKTFSARRINKNRRQKGVPVWQRGYYEHIIRNEQSLTAIREYIVNNPIAWEEDELHPSGSQEWDGTIKNLALHKNRR